MEKNFDCFFPPLYGIVEQLLCLPNMVLPLPCPAIGFLPGFLWVAFGGRNPTTVVPAGPQILVEPTDLLCPLHYCCLSQNLQFLLLQLEEFLGFLLVGWRGLLLPVPCSLYANNMNPHALYLPIASSMPSIMDMHYWNLPVVGFDSRQAVVC